MSADGRLRWAVVGGGALGLTLALRLQEAGQQVTLYEAAPSLGGLASAWQVGPVVWDRYYHVISLSDTRLRGLLAELGLEDRIAWRTTRTNFYGGGRLHPLNNAMDYVRLPVLGFFDKFRLATTILKASRIEDGRPLEQLTAGEWLSRLSGRRTYENLWRPLLRSKLGSNHERASASFIWSVIRRFYGARQGSSRTEMFGYVPGGYARILSALEKRLRQTGVDVRTSAAVTAIDGHPGGLQVSTADGTSTFDRVVVTGASPQAARICTTLLPEERERHATLAYQGIVCLSLLLKRPLGGAYMTYITDDAVPFTTVIEMTSLVDRELTAGRHLVYLPKYLPQDDPLLDAPDEEITRSFIAGLRLMYPDLSDDDVEVSRIARTRYVQALPTLDYSTKLPSMTTSQPGLYIVNSAQIVNASLNIDEGVRLVERVMPWLLEHAAMRSPEAGLPEQAA